MSNKTFVFYQIKKLMGWCPNSKTLEAETRISSANFEVNNLSGGEKASQTAPSQHSRLDAHLLLLPIFFTPIYKTYFKKV
jgi:hypothetical protein